MGSGEATYHTWSMVVLRGWPDPKGDACLLTELAMHRRSVLGGCTAILSGLLAGCNSGDSSGVGPTESRPPPPARDRAPEALLPTAPDGWTRVGTSDITDLPVDAEAGAGATYEPTAGSEYEVRVYRWDSNGAARAGAGDFEAWTAYVVLGNFSFVVRGPNRTAAVTILGASPAFTAEFVRDNDLLD